MSSFLSVEKSSSDCSPRNPSSVVLKTVPMTAPIFMSSCCEAGSRSMREVMSDSTELGSFTWSMLTVSLQAPSTTSRRFESIIDLRNSSAQKGLPFVFSASSGKTSSWMTATPIASHSSSRNSLTESPGSSRTAVSQSLCSLTISSYPAGRTGTGSGRRVSSTSIGLTTSRACRSTAHEDESIQCTSSKMRIGRPSPSLAASTLTISRMVAPMRVSPIRCFVTSLSLIWMGRTGESSGASITKDSSASNASSADGRTQWRPSNA